MIILRLALSALLVAASVPSAALEHDYIFTVEITITNTTTEPVTPVISIAPIAGLRLIETYPAASTLAAGETLTTWAYFQVTTAETKRLVIPITINDDTVNAIVLVNGAFAYQRALPLVIR